MTGLFHDLRYALRQLRKSPGFATVAVLTLALGIGANTAIFSVVRAVLLKTLPYGDPDRLMILDEYQQRTGRMSVAWPNFLDWRDQNHSFQAMAAYRQDQRSLTGVGEPMILRVGEVSSPLFSLLGAEPILGRTFSAAEDKPGADPTAVLSYAFWRNRMGGDTSVLGRAITLSGVPVTVVGVLPPDFSFFQDRRDLYLPLGLEGSSATWLNRENHPGLRVLARLKPEISKATAQTDMDGLMGRLEQQYPGSNSGERASVASLYDYRFAELRPTFYTLLAAVACVLLIACGNMANLFLARAAARQKEFAVRLAIGAGRMRVARQLLTESVLLSVGGGLLGLLAARWAITPLLRLAPQDIPRLADTKVDAGVMLFTFAISILTGILFGFAPAWQSSRTKVNDSLKDSGGTVTPGRFRQRLRASLLVSEVALALVLVFACGLLIRSLFKAQRVDPGFNADHVLALDVLLPSRRYHDDQKIAQFFYQALERIRTLPGVASASAVLCPPLVGTCWNSVYLVSGRPNPTHGDIPSSAFNIAEPDYFRTMQIPLLEGRYFTATDDAKSPPVIIINRTLAELWWPHESPLGQRIKQGFPQDNTPYREIVGVVGDLKQEGLDAVQLPEVFEPVLQSPSQAMTVTVRTEGDAQSMASEAVGVIQSVDKDLPVSAIQPMNQYVSESLARRKFSTLLLGLFGGLALLLAAVGIYGVMGYTVAQRGHEIGIRMALGARQHDVLALMVSYGLRLTFIGIAIGLTLAFLLAHGIASLLFRVSDKDPMTFIAVAALLSGVAGLASYIPARRAAKVDPMVALRYE